MPNHIRLFERSLIADEVLPALMVTGALPDCTPKAAYEGRLPILNSVGKCTVEVLESTLPPGAFVRVDNITKEVVVKWAAYKEEEEPISLVPGGDFEDGDSGSWSLGNGWSIGTGPAYDVKSGAYSARFAEVKTKGSDMVSPRVPAKVNDYIRVSAQVQQGASAKGNAGARVSLIYRNADGAELLRLWGNLVTSGKNGAWNGTVAEGAAPADTATVEVVISAYRNRENFALWVDDVVWNHKYTLGQDKDEDLFLSIRVTDSINRSATWSGGLGQESVIVMSALYPLLGEEPRSTQAYTDTVLKIDWFGGQFEPRGVVATASVDLRSLPPEYGQDSRGTVARPVLTLREEGLHTTSGTDSRSISATASTSMRRTVLPGRGTLERGTAANTTLTMEVV